MQTTNEPRRTDLDKAEAGKSVDDLIVQSGKWMDEIETLSKSGSLDDRLRAITIFEERFPRLPSGKSRDFIREQMASPDASVAKKAKEVYERTVKPSEKQMADHWKSVGEELVGAIQKFGETVKGTNEKLFARVAGTANGLLFASNLEEISDHVGEQGATGQPAGRSAGWKGADIAIESDPYGSEAVKLVRKQGDVGWNIDGYKLLVTLEIVIRRLIAERLIYCDQAVPLSNAIPKDIYDKCLERMRYERDSLLVESSQDWLDYLDFSDLAMLIEKGRNRMKIVGHLDKVKQAMVISKLRELEPIRNKLSHSRFLSEREYQKLSFQAEDLFKLLLSTDQQAVPIENPYDA
ncbi:MAG: hypothetical protein LUO79_02975 [Methanomassiliicoccales archaeon]|nr:hypothetical protein [Methanomassiliicoccales archaeon]